jgi:hypothetical protein
MDKNVGHFTRRLAFTIAGDIVAIKLLSLTEMVSGCSSNCPCFLSIHLPACISTDLIGHIYMKINMEDS